MKALIAGIAIIILSIYLCIFQIDNYNCRLEAQKLKYCSDEASYQAALYYNEDNWKIGQKIYLEEDGISSIEEVIKNSLKTNNLLQPTEYSYWIDKISYTAYFFDDDNICSVYTDGILTKQFNFTYPYLYEDKQLKYFKSISQSVIIVTINAGRATYHLSFLSEPVIIRSSGYEYDI